MYLYVIDKHFPTEPYSKPQDLDLKKDLFIFLYIGVSSVYMYLYHTHACCLRKSLNPWNWNYRQF